MSALFLKDARFADWRTLQVTRGDFEVEAGDGGKVAPVDRIPDGAETVDCAGRLVTRAFAIAHHHVYSTLARGMPPPRVPPRSFVEILERVWWRLDKALDEDMIRGSARACAVLALRRGCTFLADHHSSPSAAAGSLHVLAEELDRAGVGHLLCYELSDRDGPERLEAGFRETEAYLERRQGLVGLHASFTVSPALLERAVDLAKRRGTGIHVHVAESEHDQRHCVATYGCRVVERLERSGALDSTRTLLAHALHLSDEERAILQDSRAWVVHCPESNQHNAVGRFDPRGLGDRVLLGTDGMHSEVLAAVRAAFLEGQALGGLTPVDAYRRMRRVHDYLESNAVPGHGENDLVIFDYDSPTPVHAGNVAAHVVYGLTGGDVRMVIRGGRVVVQEGRLVGVDQDEVLAHAREQAERLWSRLS